MRVWRLCKERFAEAAFSGEGAWRFSGRWNRAGTRMVYTSTSLALAAMEFFVHLDPSEMPEDIVTSSATIPSDVVVERISPTDLPANWREIDLVRLQAMGSEWIESGRTAALEVPSVVVDGDWNVLLNPAHPEFHRIVVDAPRVFRFDERMFRRE